MRNTHAMVTRRSAAVAVSTSDACQPPVAISMRHIFVPFSGQCLVAGRLAILTCSTLIFKTLFYCYKMCNEGK